MKKQILILLTILFAAGAASGQDSARSLRIENLRIQHADGQVIVRFDGQLPKRAIKKEQSFYFVPVITDGTYKVSLAPVSIQSRKAQLVTRRRLRIEAEAGRKPATSIQTVKPGQTFTYHASANFQPWMHGTTLTIESIVGGCCSTREGEILLAEGILPAPQPVVVIPEPEPEPEIVETTGGRMERTFPFVLPASEFNPESPVYDDDREGALIVYYKLNKFLIEQNHSTNRQTLVNLEAAIRMIDSSVDSRVKHIVIAGFASPEGSFELNDRLAFERAVSVKEYVAKATGTDAGKILLYNGSADWKGLRILVAASDMAGKDEILRIIDTVPVWNAKTQTGRMAEIRKLRGGASYRYMAEHFFPLLRNGAFIRVYYEDLPEE